MAQPLFDHVETLLRGGSGDIISQEVSGIHDRLQSAIRKLSQKIEEDPDHREMWKQQKARGEALLKQWTQVQRRRILKEEHNELTTDAKVRGESVKATHGDVHRSMARTNRALREQIEFSEAVRQRMGEGTSELKKTHDRYAEVKEELDRAQRLLKQLDHQARMDKIWITAGIVIFAAAVLLVVVERLPRHYIPLFWIMQ